MGGGGEEYQCSDELKNFCEKRLKFDDTFIIPEITTYKVGKYVSSVGSKTTSGCDGISNKVEVALLSELEFKHQVTTAMGEGGRRGRGA